jgi:uncharacterized 2Fe-2S/4Fe-4S cluster protein (DUF4445 family)
MALVKFFPGNNCVEVEDGITILQAARLAGVVIEAPCNSNATCGKCKVKVSKKFIPRLVQTGMHRLSESETRQEFVLACQSEIQGDIEVELVDNHENKSLKILNFGKSFDFPVKSYISKQFFPENHLTRVFGGGQEIGVEEGDTAGKNYGLVIDIGTTTVVTAIFDLNTGEEMSSESALNPQSIYAQDVLSRIKFASNEKGLETLYQEFIMEVNRMIVEITGKAEIAQQHIYEVIFSGNTCMLHLATKVNPTSLGRYPYTPAIRGGNYLRAIDHKLNVSPFGLIYLPPIISPYVGADITSGILASQVAEQNGITLFVDIGTNGEMVIAVDSRLSSTSTAAGPAFEGMNITFGMRAGNGAVERFEVGANGTVSVKTIGESIPIGICGSGLIDIVGELVSHGVINASGKFVKPGSSGLAPALSERLVEYEGKPAFKVAGRVILTQKDVRQVQLAKGAIRAGIEFLLRSKGIQAGDVDRVLIAGSFGYHLRAENLLNIGLLPAEFAGKIEFIGNTSKTGGRAFLLNRNFKVQMLETVNQVESLELADYRDFDKVFVRCLNF